MDIILFYIILHINNFWTNPCNTKKDSQPFYTQLKKNYIENFLINQDVACNIGFSPTMDQIMVLIIRIVLMNQNL